MPTRSSPQRAASTPSLTTPAWRSTPCSTPPPQQHPLSQVSQISQISQLPRQLLISQTIGIPIHKQHLSQMYQLPRQLLSPQTTRIPIHKQHPSQVSQLSQLPPQRRPQPPPPHPQPLRPTLPRPMN